MSLLARSSPTDHIFEGTARNPDLPEYRRQGNRPRGHSEHQADQKSRAHDCYFGRCLNRQLRNHNNQRHNLGPGYFQCFVLRSHDHLDYAACRVFQLLQNFPANFDDQGRGSLCVLK